MKLVKHFGVYGICIHQNKLLCIQKNGGPYHGRFDLPGGSQKEHESLIDTLNREIREETGFQITSITNNRIFDVFVEVPAEKRTVHHLFAVYDIQVDTQTQADIFHDLGTEENDSRGIFWIDINELTIDNTSPLILRVLEQKETFEAERYTQWIVLEN